jgi:MoaA/NifB/PqqE/SkfB family radical SAM enzyme
MRTTSSARSRPRAESQLPALLIQPEVVTILGTYRCTAACENCCFGSNPYLTKRLALDDILAFIEESSHYPSCQLVVFSGGECFLLGDDLATAIEYATSLGLRTRCVTNGYWAKSLRHGRRRLSAIVEAGLKELNVSTGDFHQQWVAQDTVVNAACLAVEAGLRNTVVMVELQKERRVTAASIAADPRVRELLAVEGAPFRLIESPWMPMNAEDHIAQSDNQLLSRRTLHLRGGCESVLRTLVVTPERRFGFCCGLTRERVPELNAPWDRGTLNDLLDAGSRDFMKIWLHVDGPERILAWAAGKDSRIDWEGRYAHHCHACFALYADPLVREAIRTHHRERIDDVLARYVAELRTQQAESTDFATAG